MCRYEKWIISRFVVARLLMEVSSKSKSGSVIIYRG